MTISVDCFRLPVVRVLTIANHTLEWARLAIEVRAQVDLQELN